MVIVGHSWAPKYTRRDSRGERSPWLPLETRPDSPGEPGMQPRDPCRPWREKLGGAFSGVSSSCGARGGFLTRQDEDLREPLVRCQGSQVSVPVASKLDAWALRIQVHQRDRRATPEGGRGSLGSPSRAGCAGTQASRLPVDPVGPPWCRR